MNAKVRGKFPEKRYTAQEVAAICGSYKPQSTDVLQSVPTLPGDLGTVSDTRALVQVCGHLSQTHTPIHNT